MPHLNKTRKDELRLDPKLANSEGDFNFLFTVAYLQHWLKEGNQRYKTIHKIRKASFQPATLEEVAKVEDLLTVQQVPIMDRIIARDLAFKEFERHIVGSYESFCALKNGLVEEYEPALDKMDELFSKLGE